MNDGYPSSPQFSAGQILARLTASATLAAGALLHGAGSAALTTLALGTAGRVLVAGASAPAWSDAGLSYASGVLAIAGSVPGTPSAGQVLIGGGAGKFGGTVSCTTLSTTATSGNAVVLAGDGDAGSTAVGSLLGSLIRHRRYGYSTSYSAVQIGDDARGVGFGFDPSTIAGGGFDGNALDCFFKRGVHLGCPNSGGTNWVWGIRLSGGTASSSSMVDISDTGVAVAGTLTVSGLVTASAGINLATGTALQIAGANRIAGTATVTNLYSGSTAFGFYSADGATQHGGFGNSAGTLTWYGAAPGAPGVNEVSIGAGQIKAGAGISGASLTIGTPFAGSNAVQIAGSLNLNGGESFKIADVIRLTGGAGYTQIVNPSGVISISLGTASNYYDQDAHYFRTAAGAAGAVNVGTLVATGKITTVSAVPGSFADLAAVQTWLAANFT